MRQFLRALLTWPVALLLLFEEWGWEPLQRLLARLARWPFIAWLERRIATLPPKLALVVFIGPSLALVPVKLAALALIGAGHAVLGAMVIVAAKLAGTAVVARLFTLTRPALMSMPWFARAYGRWTTWKDAVFAQVRASWPWRIGRVMRRGVARRWARWRSAP